MLFFFRATNLFLKHLVAFMISFFPSWSTVSCEIQFPFWSLTVWKLLLLLIFILFYFLNVVVSFVKTEGLTWLPEWGNHCLEIKLDPWFILEMISCHRFMDSRGRHHWVQFIEAEMTECQLAFPLRVIWTKARPKWIYFYISCTDHFLSVYK